MLGIEKSLIYKDSCLHEAVFSRKIPAQISSTTSFTNEETHVEMWRFLS